VYTRPSAPQGIGGVLDDGLRLWRSSLAKTWPLAFLAQLAIAVPIVLFSMRFQPIVPIAPRPSGGALSALNAANAQLLQTVFGSPMFLIAYFGAILLTIGMYNAITLSIAAVSRGESLSFGGALAGGFRLLPRSLWLTLIVILAFVGVGIVFAVLAGIGSVIGAGARGLIVTILGVAVFVAIIVLFGRLFLSGIVLVAEDTPAFRSLGVSWNLTRGHWWRCAVIVFVLIVIALVFTLIVSFVAGLVAATLGPASLTGVVANQVISIVINSFVGSLYAAAFLAILHDLRLHKEGGDLAARVSALASR
jgi:hypothetical protein